MTTKEKVLDILQKNNQSSAASSYSGEKLAELCGVSRAAVWKAVKTLREEGYSIEGTTNGGYLLNPQNDVFSLELLQQFLGEKYPELSDCHVECFKEIDSTNTYAKRLLSECGNLRGFDGALTESGKKYHNSVFVAESQTAGRGRLGRTFYSPKKTGIYLTVVYAPEGGITEPAKLTAVSAVAVCRVLKRLFNLDAKIKWINDIYAGGKKICGILTEGFTNFETAQIESAVIGIGINLDDNPEELPSEVAKIAGSVRANCDAGENSCDSGKFVSRCEVAAAVAGEVLSIMEEVSADVIKEYKDLSFLIGQTLQIHPVIGDEKSVYSATAVDIDENAALVVQLADGTLRHLNSGEVTLHSASY